MHLQFYLVIFNYAKKNYLNLIVMSSHSLKTDALWAISVVLCRHFSLNHLIILLSGLKTVLNVKKYKHPSY